MRRRQEASEGSLFAALANGISAKDPATRLRRLETGLGLLGFFCVVAVVNAASAVAQGQSMGPALLVAVALLNATYLVWRRWRQLGEVVARNADPRGVRP